MVHLGFVHALRDTPVEGPSEGCACRLADFKVSANALRDGLLGATRRARSVGREGCRVVVLAASTGRISRKHVRVGIGYRTRVSVGEGTR